MKIVRKRCNCGTWACRIDGLLHLFHLRWRRVCDEHDRQIMGMDPWAFAQWSSPDSKTWVYFDSTTASSPGWRVVPQHGEDES